MKNLNDIEIRKARTSEIEEIADLQGKLELHHRQIDSKYYTRSKDAKNVFMKYIRKRIKDRNSLLLVAVCNGKIVGYTLGIIKSYPPVRKIKKFGYVSDAFVEECYRSKGIARSFIEELRAWFKVRKLKYMELHVDSRNKLGLAAWRKAGFKEIQKRMIRKI